MEVTFLLVVVLTFGVDSTDTQVLSSYIMYPQIPQIPQSSVLQANDWWWWRESSIPHWAWVIYLAAFRSTFEEERM